MNPKLRVFLDANILFSASHTIPNPFQRLWHVAGVQCVTSTTAIEEVTRNIRRPEQTTRLHDLLGLTEIVGPEVEAPLPPDIQLVEKDIHVLASAIGCRANYLLTGDRRHFAHLFFRSVAGVVTMLPADFLDRFPHV